jgi:hypothetical protein
VTELPPTHAPAVIRADFSAESVWVQLQEEIVRPTPEGFEAWVAFLEDSSLDGLDAEEIAARMPRTFPTDYIHPVVFVVDAVTVAAPEHPLLVISTHEQPDRPFRCVPAAVQAIQNNLSLANLDFADFASAAAPDEVFRGFDST